MYKYLAATQKDKDKGGGGGEGEGGGEIIVGDDILRRRPLYEKGRGEGEGEGGAGAGVSLGRGMTKTRTTHSPSKMRVSERRTRRESKKGSKRGSKRQERVMSYRREKVDFLVSGLLFIYLFFEDLLFLCLLCILFLLLTQFHPLTHTHNYFIIL